MLNWFSFLFLLIFIHIDSASNNSWTVASYTVKTENHMNATFPDLNFISFALSLGWADKLVILPECEMKALFLPESLYFEFGGIYFRWLLFDQFAQRMNKYMWMNWFPMNETNELSARNKKKTERRIQGEGGQRLCNEILHSEAIGRWDNFRKTNFSTFIYRNLIFPSMFPLVGCWLLVSLLFLSAIV